MLQVELFKSSCLTVALIECKAKPSINEWKLAASSATSEVSSVLHSGIQRFLSAHMQAEEISPGVTASVYEKSWDRKKAPRMYVRIVCHVNEAFPADRLRQLLGKKEVVLKKIIESVGTGRKRFAGIMKDASWNVRDYKAGVSSVFTPNKQSTKHTTFDNSK